MMEVGRLAVKIAGREAGRKCVIIDIIDKNYVLIDGDVRRKKCNPSHLEPLDNKIEIARKASHEAVVDAFKKIGITIKETKAKPKKQKPTKLRKKEKKELEKKKEEKKPKPKKEAKKEIKEKEKQQNKGSQK